MSADVRRPMAEEEALAAARLGRVLRGLREDAGLAQNKVASAAEISPRHLRRLEHGERRTRTSTLARLAAALAVPPATVDEVREVLLAAAEPAVAPESDFIDRVARRRERRHRQHESSLEIRTTVEVWSGMLTRYAREWVDTEGRTRRDVRYVLVSHDGTQRAVQPPEIAPSVFHGHALPRRFRTR